MNPGADATETRPRVLIVDDDRVLAETLADELSSDGFDTTHVSTSRDALQLIQEPFDALITDLRMPTTDGLGLLAASRRAAPERPVIVMTAFSAVDTAIESIRQGAYHYLTKPFKVDELALFLERALAEASLRRETTALRRVLGDASSLSGVVGRRGAMRAVCDLVIRIADATTPVLIVGETGTGKGLIARALHGGSRRAGHAFVTLNCAAVPENLLESELFGHVRGSFTGATANRVGLIEEASGGTLFLDEIGEMPLALQAKLLHVLESGVVRAVGANKERSIDVRFVAATHRDLREQVSAGQFREDLMFRLNVLTVPIPPLRARKEDFPELVAHFLERARSRHVDSPVKRISAQAFDRLLIYRWPGNVRELANVIERAVLLGTSEEVAVEDFQASLGEQGVTTEFSGPVRSLQEIDKRYALWALDQFGGRRMATAEALEIDRKTLAKLLDESKS
jgi:two-component system, NtrC family, response regulator HydG